LDKASNQLAGFSVFAFTWAMACFFHQLSFADWRWYDFKGIILSGAVLLVLYKPSSWQRFAALLVVDWVSVAWESPLHPNHIVFSWIVNGTLLAALVMVVVKSKDISETDLASRWYAAFAPWVCIELCVLYFFTVFHKLNVSYFDVDWSCAARLHLEIHDRFSLLPDAKWALYAAIYGTLIIEVAIPLLLLFRRTRVTGVLLGLLFHGLLALHPHAGLISFSSTMTALFTAFLPLSTAMTLKPRNEIRKAWRWGLFALGVFLVLWIFRKLLPGLRLEGMVTQAWKAGFVGFFTYLAFGLAMFIRSLKTTRSEIQTRPGSWRTHPWLAGFTLLLLVNGFGPYFGLRTQTSFTMFSNLHTENGTCNHLIVPSGIQITNWQYDVVEIIDSNEPDLIRARDNGLFVVYLELRRTRTGAGQDFWVTFRRKGRIETFDMKRSETYSAVPTLGPLAKRYFYFRDPVRDPEKVMCQQ
jgi:hypothetical protein